MPEAYRNVCKMRLAQISEIEGAVLQEYQDNPQKAIDKPQLLKQIKQGAGALSDDDKPAPTFVNIKYCQNMMLKAHEHNANGNYKPADLLDEEITQKN
jgi:hypothetical protein